MSIPHINNCLPKSKSTDHYCQYRTLDLALETRSDRQDDHHKGKESLDVVQPRLYFDEGVFIVCVESVEANVDLVGRKVGFVDSSFKGVWSEEDVGCVKDDD